VNNAQLPVSFYSINDTNYNFYIGLGGTNYTINIPFGNYNSSTIISTIISLWTATGGGGTPITISISPSNGKLTFGCASAITLLFPNFIIGSTTQKNFSYKIFGFEKVTNYTGTSITAPYPLNLLGVKKIYVKSDYLSTVGYTSSQNGGSDIIATIPSDVAPFNMISYVQTIETQKYLLRNETINLIDIKLTDEDDNYLNFNNIDWTITITISNDRIDRAKENVKINDIVTPIDFPKFQAEEIQPSFTPDTFIGGGINDEELQLLEKNI
jgi:hypothetical protein